MGQSGAWWGGDGRGGAGRTVRGRRSGAGLVEGKGRGGRGGRAGAGPGWVRGAGRDGRGGRPGAVLRGRRVDIRVPLCDASNHPPAFAASRPDGGRPVERNARTSAPGSTSHTTFRDSCGRRSAGMSTRSSRRPARRVGAPARPADGREPRGRRVEPPSRSSFGRWS